MTRLPPPLLALIVALPAFALALVGSFHPTFLNPDTADRWFVAHLVLLPLFPLPGLALWWLVRNDTGPVALAVRLLAYAYAVLYTLLDAASGVVLSWVVGEADDQGRPGPALDLFFQIGDDIGRPGALCLLVGAILMALQRYQRDGWLVLVGGGLLALGAWMLYKYHVFPGSFPESGVLGAIIMGAGLAAATYAQAIGKPEPVPAPGPETEVRPPYGG